MIIGGAAASFFLVALAAAFVRVVGHGHEQHASTNASHGDPCLAQSSFSNSVALRLAADANVTILYTVDCQARTIEFNVTTENCGWVGIGFNINSSKMANADLYQMSIDANANVVVRNARGVDRAIESNLSMQAIFSGEPRGSVHDGSISVAFKRFLSANVSSQLTLSYQNPLYLLVARRLADANMDEAHLNEHDGGAVASDIPVQLFATQAITADRARGDDSEPLSTVELLAIAHGIAMLLAWVGAANAGILVARRFKRRLIHRWYSLHRNIMLGLAFLVALGLALAVAHVQLDGGAHFKALAADGLNPHSSLGLFVCIGAIVQAVVGFVSNRMFRADRREVPCFPDRLHWWFGRLLVLASYLNVFFGLWLWTSHAFSAVAVLFMLVTVSSAIAQSHSVAPATEERGYQRFLGDLNDRGSSSGDSTRGREGDN